MVPSGSLVQVMLLAVVDCLRSLKHARGLHDCCNQESALPKVGIEPQPAFESSHQTPQSCTSAPLRSVLQLSTRRPNPTAAAEGRLTDTVEGGAGVQIT